jgi:hypothetical protein
MGKDKAKRYVVTGEYIMAATTDPASGQRVMLGWYRGSLLPEDISDESIEHHLSTRQIQAVKLDENGALTEWEDERVSDPAEAKVADGLGEPNTMGPALEARTDAVADGNEVKAGDQVDEPKKSTGTRDEWVEYAVSKGADRGDIEAKKVTKADLIATWGTPNK